VKKYDEHNWEKGQQVSRYLDSATRSSPRLLLGDRIENHLAIYGGTVSLKFKPKELNEVPTTGATRHNRDGLPIGQELLMRPEAVKNESLGI